MTHVMSEYCWRSALRRALKKNRREAHSRYLQLASVDECGEPRNRTVVFRGFGDSDALLIITDQRSEKYTQLLARPHVEVCWYFTISREQFRLRGRARMVTDAYSEQDLRAQVWSALSPAAKEQFFWSHPGLPLPDDSADLNSAESFGAGGTTNVVRQTGSSHVPADASDDMEAPQLPEDAIPDTFVLVMIYPQQVDHLVLSSPQRRIISTWDESKWNAVEVNP